MSSAKSLVLPAAILLVALGAASCGGQADQEFFSFESFSVSAVAASAGTDSVADRPEGFDGRWQVSSEGVMPVKIGPHELTALLDTLSSLACVNLASSDPEVQLPAGLSALPATAGADSVTPGSRLMKNLTLDMLNPRVAVFRVYTYSYPEGAAHGMYSNMYVNYDVAGGNVVTLSTLFSPGFERRLQPEILSRLKESGEPLLVDDDEVDVSTDFRITDDGVEFIYGLYSVAPYAAGEQKVAFYSYELDDILSPAGKALLGIK